MKGLSSWSSVKSLKFCRVQTTCLRFMGSSVGVPALGVQGHRRVSRLWVGSLGLGVAEGWGSDVGTGVDSGCTSAGLGAARDRDLTSRPKP